VRGQGSRWGTRFVRTQLNLLLLRSSNSIVSPPYEAPSSWSMELRIQYVQPVTPPQAAPSFIASLSFASLNPFAPFGRPAYTLSSAFRPCLDARHTALNSVPRCG